VRNFLGRILFHQKVKIKTNGSVWGENVAISELSNGSQVVLTWRKEEGILPCP